VVGSSTTGVSPTVVSCRDFAPAPGCPARCWVCSGPKPAGVGVVVSSVPVTAETATTVPESVIARAAVLPTLANGLASRPTEVRSGTPSTESTRAAHRVPVSVSRTPIVPPSACTCGAAGMGTDESAGARIVDGSSGSMVPPERLTPITAESSWATSRLAFSPAKTAPSSCPIGLFIRP
jgi:hypothetical protein